MFFPELAEPIFFKIGSVAYGRHFSKLGPAWKNFSLSFVALKGALRAFPARPAEPGQPSEARRARPGQVAPAISSRPGPAIQAQPAAQQPQLARRTLTWQCQAGPAKAAQPGKKPGQGRQPGSRSKHADRILSKIREHVFFCSNP